MSILQDPVMQSILQQAKGDPAALQEHMKNAQVRSKIQKLIAAGVIRLGRWGVTPFEVFLGYLISVVSRILESFSSNKKGKYPTQFLHTVTIVWSVMRPISIWKANDQKRKKIKEKKSILLGTNLHTMCSILR